MVLLNLSLQALLDAHNDPTVDAIEIDAIAGSDDDNKPVSNYDDATNMEVSHSDDDVIICWSVYVHRTGQGVECIADFATEGEATKWAKELKKGLGLKK